MFSEPPSPLPLYSWQKIHPHAKLHYIRNAEQANAQIKLLQGPMGFDLEWRPNFISGEDHPVSLVQLANNKTILLMQISAMKEFPKKLQEFLESPDFVKTGADIQKDARKLYDHYQVSMRNCVDLSSLAYSVDGARWEGNNSRSLGLAGLVKVYEKLLLPKDRQITLSDWEAEPLSREQQEYAANDAHAGYIVYKKLIVMSSKVSSATSPKRYTFDLVRDSPFESSDIHWHSGYDPAPPPSNVSIPIKLLAATVAILIVHMFIMRNFS